MDFTDMIDYNMELLNHHDLTSSFFHLSREDPVHGFSFDASIVSGHLYPSSSLPLPLKSSESIVTSPDPPNLLMRLILGSHLAQHLRHNLEEQRGYTSTVGVSTNKLLSKLVGNVHKPKGQTTLAPPYISNIGEENSNVHRFIDEHDIGKIPGIGFKVAQKIRNHVLQRPAAFSTDLVYGGTKENVKAGEVRVAEGMGSELLTRLLGSPGTSKDIGEKVWGLVNGVDESEVAKARIVPKQISIEDSYIKLDQLDQVKHRMTLLARRLIGQIRTDLTSVEDEDEVENPLADGEGDEAHSVPSASARRWIAFPQSLRLSTRPRPPRNADGSRSRNFTRISKSGPMPSFIFQNNVDIDHLADRLLKEALLPLFRQLHPEKSLWDLSLVNICATNMALVGGDNKDGAGRNIEKMFRNQDVALKPWKVDGTNEGNEQTIDHQAQMQNKIRERPESNVIGLDKEDAQKPNSSDLGNEDDWNSEDDVREEGHPCFLCGARIPDFAMDAHNRFHGSKSGG